MSSSISAVSQDVQGKDIQARCSLLTPTGISQQKGCYKESFFVLQPP